jgi:predicted nucleic-acid-binding Zn-ribbon protein
MSREQQSDKARMRRPPRPACPDCGNNEWRTLRRNLALSAVEGDGALKHIWGLIVRAAVCKSCGYVRLRLAGPHRDLSG